MLAENIKYLKLKTTKIEEGRVTTQRLGHKGYRQEQKLLDVMKIVLQERG